MRKFLIIIFIIFLLNSCSSGVQYYLPFEQKKISSGLENFINNYAEDYRGKKAVLVTNQSGVDRKFSSNIDLLRKKGILIPTVLAPEHGIYGYENSYDKRSFFPENSKNLLIYNLHRINKSQCRFLIRKADLVIFDIQDMGMRCYTYISNLKFIIDSMQGLGIELIVLDRPNPIDFLGIDGAYLDKNFTSRFIGSFPAPFIYDLTIGEAAIYYKHEFAKNIPLRVIKMRKYTPGMLYHNTGLPWVPPSPNLPTYASSIIYSAVVLLEGTNISLGRGTPKPFEYIGAPWIDPVKFCNDLKKIGLKNFRVRPVYFKPTFSKYAGKRCGGAHLFYTGGRFSPTEISFKIISYLKKEYPSFEWKLFKKWYDIDYLAGTDLFRKSIDRGLTYNEYHKEIKKDIGEYRRKAGRYKIY